MYGSIYLMQHLSALQNIQESSKEVLEKLVVVVLLLSQLELSTLEFLVEMMLLSSLALMFL